MPPLPDLSHRDRRAQRDVDRAFWWMTGVIVALTAFALLVPLPFAGLLAVVALAVLGVAYLGWGERLLTGYATDLRSARDGVPSAAFTRAEVAKTVGPEGDGEGAPSPSPHSRRRRSRGTLRNDPDLDREPEEETGQL